MLQGALYIISAPSGAGKTSLVEALLKNTPSISTSVSYTTRRKRPAEQDGINYHFVDRPTFQNMIRDGVFLEYAELFDNFYGTARASVEAQLAAGQDVILEIDWQGAQQVREQMPPYASIFILPPSKNILQQRLHARNQDSQTIIQQRMDEANRDISHYNEYDYVIINDDFNDALSDLSAIFRARRLLLETQTSQIQAVIDRLLRD